jgi:hypothetical protein
MSQTLEHKLEDRLEFLKEQKLPAVITPVEGESLQALLRDERESLTVIRR